jgi:hypothetical protein
MAFVNHFYNATTRKYVALFGTIFNKISITRDDLSSAEKQRMIVPIAYGPFQKFLSRIIQDPNLDNPSAITLPRMSFEITNMTYDGTRKIASKQRMQKTIGETDDQKLFVWSGAPYNIDFSLYIMTKYSEDATKIVEQIIPFFRPEWTATVKLINDLPPIDIPIVLNGITNEDLYEGSYEQRRSVLWTLNFTMKAWYFGPERKKSVIKFVDVDIWTDLDASKDPEEGVNVFPGLTADGSPTTDPDLTIPYTDIEYDDDWGVIRVITSNPEDE